jgi:N-acyl-D-amino-acid deacylase
MSRILIKGGTIHNGDNFIGKHDLLIENDQIAEFGHLDNVVDVSQVIDASFLVVSPGFIDCQNMTFQLEKLDKNDGINLTTQGVTSAVIGNCGNSGILDAKDTFVNRLNYLREIRLGINVGMLVGHNSLRKFILGTAERYATKDEITRMATIVEDALSAGALGMSSGLMYTPGLFAAREELVRLTSIVGKYNKTYATHMRDEGDYLEEAVLEALDTAASSKSRLLISHFKVTGKQNRGKSIACVKLMEQRHANQDFSVDYYPYSATATVLSIMILPEFLTPINGDLRKLQFSSDDEKLIERTGKQNLCLNSWSDIVVATCTDSKVIGKSISEISGENSESPYQSVVKILNYDPATRVVFHNVADENELENIAVLPYAMVVTDGYIYNSDSLEATHPRNYGAFPRALRKFVTDKPIITLEEFIRKSTSLPAEVFNMQRRGRIQKGYFADIAIFKTEEIKENATYETPFLIPNGMRNVLINGEVVLHNNKSTGRFPGRLIQ